MFDGQHTLTEPLQLDDGMSANLHPYRFLSLKQIIDALNLATNLKVCLDAADLTSYGGSGQSWVDLSGNTEDFFLGATSGSEASDPTFTGTAGYRTAGSYFAQDGGDFFRYKTTNAAWMQTLHKDNAIFTACFWFYPATLGNAIWGTLGSTSGNTGVRYGFSADGTATLFVLKAGTSELTQAVVSTITANAWNFVGISLNEATGSGGLIIRTNGNTETFTSTYASPTTNSASFTMEIGAGGNALIPLANGSRFAQAAIWQGTALSSTDLANLYAATRVRFGV